MLCQLRKIVKNKIPFDYIGQISTYHFSISILRLMKGVFYENSLIVLITTGLKLYITNEVINLKKGPMRRLRHDTIKR